MEHLLRLAGRTLGALLRAGLDPDPDLCATVTMGLLHAVVFFGVVIPLGVPSRVSVGDPHGVRDGRVRSPFLAPRPLPPHLDHPWEHLPLRRAAPLGCQTSPFQPARPRCSWRAAALPLTSNSPPSGGVTSIRVAIPVALVEIVLGALAGNIPGIKEHVLQTPYTTFLASVGSVVLTFLAGAEIDPVSLRKHWKASLSIGFVSFLLPLLGAFAFCRVALGWRFHSAEVGGVALSTTSVAVVVRGDGGDRAEPPGHRQADPGRVLCHRPRDGAGPRRSVRQLRVVARRVRGGHAGCHRRATEPHAVVRGQGWAARERTRCQVPPGGAPGPGRPGGPGRERGCAPRLCRRACRRRGVPP